MLIRLDSAKANYLTQIGHDLANTRIGQKTYWKLVNRITNKCKASKISPTINVLLIVKIKQLISPDFLLDNASLYSMVILYLRLVISLIHDFIM